MIGFHIAHHIGANIAGLDYAPTNPGGNVFVDWMPETPDLAVAVMHGAGLPQGSRNPDDMPTIQIIVRGNPHDSHSALAVASAIYNRFHCRDGWEATGALDPAGDAIAPVWVSGMTAQQTAPVPMGRDANTRPEFSLNFALFTNNPTTHRS